MTGTDMPMRDVSVTTQQIEDIILRTHRLAEGQRTPVSARLRYLQRLGFPKSAVTGRGRRVVHDLEDTLKITATFRFLEFAMSPVRAVRSVEMNWAHLSRALVQAWRTVRLIERSANAEAESLRVLLVIAPSALADATSDPGELEVRYGETIQLASPDEIAQWAADPRVGQSQYLVIDPHRLVGTLMSAMRSVGVAYDVEIDEAFRRLGAAAFGTSIHDEADWVFKPTEWFDV